MTEIERISNQLKRAFEGEAWHGPAVLQVLKEVTATQAAAKPIPKAHSIWERYCILQSGKMPSKNG